MLSRALKISIVISAAAALVIATIIANPNISSDGEINPKSIPATGRVSQNTAIQAVERDLSGRKEEYKIEQIATNAAGPGDKLHYVSLEEFRDQSLRLPLVYIHPNQTLIEVLGDNQYRKMGVCTTALVTYCGYLPPLNIDYKGHLVYGIEIMVLPKNGDSVGLFYLVDAINGRILDSPFIRSGIDISDNFG